MELLGEEIAEGVPKASAPGARVTKTFMFTDIVKSTNLVDAMGDQAWENLLEWHDQTLRRCFSQHHGLENNKVGDGFFVVFDSPYDAVECAVTVQRRLREHSRAHGLPAGACGSTSCGSHAEGAGLRGQGRARRGPDRCARRSR